MKIFVDTASLDKIEEWDSHPWVSGFTTNPTLMGHVTDAWIWAKDIVRRTDKPVSIDGPPEVWELGENVWRKSANPRCVRESWQRVNHTAVCHAGQIVDASCYLPDDIISVFAGRIMDTGRDPQPVIDAAKRTDAQVLWASVRESYNILQAEKAGCDIVTVPPVILRKYLDWNAKPLEVVAQETIAQFEKDSEGLWTTP